MKRTLLTCLAAAVVCACAFADDQQSLLQANKALLHAAASSDADAADKLLDDAFTATLPDGRIESRDEALEDGHSFSDVPADNLQARVYGNVGVVTAERGRRHVMVIWAKRGDAWRALVYHEVTQAESVVPAGEGSTDCTNPCKTVPYQPKNADEQGVITSWQQLETAVTAHNSAEWARHVADEFVVISSAGDKPVYKADRMAALDRQKRTNSASAPAPLVSASMFDFPNTIVMISQHQRAGGKPTHVTRVWVKRGAMWQMAYSFQTAVQQSTGPQGQ